MRKILKDIIQNDKSEVHFYIGNGLKLINFNLETDDISKLYKLSGDSTIFLFNDFLNKNDFNYNQNNNFCILDYDYRDLNNKYITFRYNDISCLAGIDIELKIYLDKNNIIKNKETLSFVMS